MAIKIKKRTKMTNYMTGITASPPDVPSGFQAVGMAEAVKHYAKPLLKIAGNDSKTIEVAFQLAMLLWNYSTGLQTNRELQKDEKEIVSALCETGMEAEEARETVQAMVLRYNHLFPKEKQVKTAPYMIMRKE